MTLPLTLVNLMPVVVLFNRARPLESVQAALKSSNRTIERNLRFAYNASSCPRLPCSADLMNFFNRYLIRNRPTGRLDSCCRDKPKNSSAEEEPEVCLEEITRRELQLTFPAPELAMAVRRFYAQPLGVQFLHHINEAQTRPRLLHEFIRAQNAGPHLIVL